MTRQAGFIINETKIDTIRPVLLSVIDLFKQSGFSVHSEINLPDLARTSLDEIAAGCDVAVVFGGDGTLLRAARSLNRRDIPIIPVNAGSLGFLTEITLVEAETAVRAFLENRYHIQQRMMLAATILDESGAPLQSFTALNDVVVSRTLDARIFSMDIKVNDQFASRIMADGLIVATPTGSTAYSLAAGGPVIHPELNLMVITPICPHSLNQRPLVVDSGAVITIENIKRADTVILTADGQIRSNPIREKNMITVTRHPNPVRLVNPRRPNFYKTLRHKLNLGNQNNS
jgi:NAD+ kinase